MSLTFLMIMVLALPRVRNEEILLKIRVVPIDEKMRESRLRQ